MDIERLLLRLKEVVGEDDGRPAQRWAWAVFARVLLGCFKKTSKRQEGVSVPNSVAKRGPKTIIRQQTPTKFRLKNGPEIVDFRPVL